MLTTLYFPDTPLRRPKLIYVFNFDNRPTMVPKKAAFDKLIFLKHFLRKRFTNRKATFKIRSKILL